MLFAVSATLIAQTSKADIYAEEAYQKRIVKEYLHGVYIPRDLSDAFVQFNKLIDKATIVKFKNLPEDQADRRLHFGFGKWISHNYNFFEGSRFSAFLNNLGLYHPDDMITFVIITYHRNINRNKLDVKLLLDKLIKNREAIIQARKLEGEVISSEKRKLEVHPDSLKQN